MKGIYAGKDSTLKQWYDFGETMTFSFLIWKETIKKVNGLSERMYVI